MSGPVGGLPAVSKHYYPEPFAAAVNAAQRGGPSPEGVRLLAWAPERPPVAIENSAIVIFLYAFSMVNCINASASGGASSLEHRIM